MKYLTTKHERNSAKITTLIMLIIVLLLFVVGQNYKDIPEEYGVALNFGDTNVVNNLKPNTSQANEEPAPEVEETEEFAEEETEEEIVEEVVEEEVEEQPEEDPSEEKKAEEKALEEKEIAEKEAAEKLLAQEAEEAAKIKEAEEAEKIKEAKEAKEKSDREAKEALEKAKAAKIAKEKAIAAKKNLEAKAAKQKAEAEAKAKKAAAKKAADDKAAAAAAKKNTGKSVSFKLIENVPVYPGCEGGDNNAKKKCMNEKIAKFISVNFNTTIISDLGLEGKQSIKIAFKINESGNVSGVRVIANHPDVKAEAKRVTNLLPKMKPGMQQGKPVGVNYSLPISINGN